MKKNLEEMSADAINVYAMDCALNSITFHARTEKEITEILYKKGFWECVVKRTISKMKDYHYIDDEQYAMQYINLKRSQKGIKMICYELSQKGISQEIIKSKSLDLGSQYDDIKAIALKFVKIKRNDEKIKEKLFRHLASKGFDFEEISQVVKDVLSGVEEE